MMISKYKWCLSAQKLYLCSQFMMNYRISYEKQNDFIVYFDADC